MANLAKRFGKTNQLILNALRIGTNDLVDVFDERDFGKIWKLWVLQMAVVLPASHSRSLSFSRRRRLSAFRIAGKSHSYVLQLTVLVH